MQRPRNQSRNSLNVSLTEAAIRRPQADGPLPGLRDKRLISDRYPLSVRPRSLP